MTFHAGSALSAAMRTAATAPTDAPRLMVAGATGLVGSEVVRRLAGSGHFSQAEILAQESMRQGLQQVGIRVVDSALPIADWQPSPHAAQVAVVMFEPPRLYYQRERALWTPQPEQLPALAAWLRRSGVHTLVIVMPHAPGRLPQALKSGLANLNEQAVTRLGFQRLLIVRSSVPVLNRARPKLLEKIAAGMLSALAYMIPQAERGARPSKLAEFVDVALRYLPPGIHVAFPELVWQAGQTKTAEQSLSVLNPMHALVQQWFAGSPSTARRLA